MSQLVTTPRFDSCCPGNATDNMNANPTLYYDVTLGTPTDQGLTPPNAGLPCLMIEISGAGPNYIWDILTGAWIAESVSGGSNWTHGAGSPITNGISTSTYQLYTNDTDSTFWTVSNGVWIMLV